MTTPENTHSTYDNTPLLTAGRAQEILDGYGGLPGRKKRLESPSWWPEVSE